MRFSCYRNDLITALQFVTRATAITPTTPITSGIYIKMGNNRVELQANNFSTGITTVIPAGVEVDGVTTVSGKNFFNIVRSMSNDTVTFELDDTLLKIQGGGEQVELLTMNHEDFPTVKVPDAEFNFTIAADDLKSLIQRTVFSVAKEDSRPIFTGCHFDIKGNVISVTATNTHRLAVAKTQSADTCPDCNFIVPAEALRALLAKLDTFENRNVQVNYSGRSVAFRFENNFIVTRVIEGEFPPADKVVPKELGTRVTVDTKEFTAAVNFISVMAKNTQYNTINFYIDRDGIRLSAASENIGKAIKDVEATVAGEDVRISFNVDYITDVLRVIDTPQLDIGLNDTFKPILITEPDNPNFLYVATPVRT